MQIAEKKISKNFKTMSSSKDGASFTNISVEEHFSVSQSTSCGQVIGFIIKISSD